MGGTPVTSRLDAGALGAGQGLLVAAVDTQQHSAVVVGSVPVEEGGSFQEAADAVQQLLPAGLHVVGSYTGGDQPAWQPRSSAPGVPCVTATNTGGVAAAWSINGQQQQGALAHAAPPAAAGNDGGQLDIAAGFVPLRAHVALELQVVFANATKAAGPANNTAANGDAGSKQKRQQPPAAALTAGMQQLTQQVLARPQQLVFVAAAAAAAAAQQPVLITASSTSSVQEALLGGTAGSSSSSGDPAISLQPLQHTSSRAAVAGKANPPPAPMFEYQPGSGSGSTATTTTHQQLLAVPLSLDVMVYAPAAASLAAVHTSLLLPALAQQLGVVQELLLAQLAAGQPLEGVRALHFRPPGLGFPVTVCYCMGAGPHEAVEAELLPRRQQLHRLLGLPDNRPMLRLANALAWGAAGAAAGEAGPPDTTSGRLRSVHEALPPPGFGGSLYLVDGQYDYHHYMQDKFNDAGWGCAYRSLQTIVSWFRAQSYTSKPVPGHRQIQEILVSIGDKEPSFVGSNKWIGSFELSYILDEYLGITCKTLAINQGADIPSHARALAQHFASQGTPVMIGGGVLAYTLLGVAFNEDTGEAAFLILDPHYTGGEDLKKITQGGWVAWKQLGDTAAAGGPLFVKDAFYNFLCPQRPCTV